MPQIDNVSDKEPLVGTNLTQEEITRLKFLKIRKKQELKLVKRFDKSQINASKECWFLVDSDWLNSWSAFVNCEENEDAPGVLSTRNLLDDKNQPLLGLKPIIDYRGVPAIVYFILVELYGKDNSPDLHRYVVDIYKPHVPVDKLVGIQITARTQAKIHVNKVRPKWLKWEREYDDDDEDTEWCCCCGLSKEHLEAFIYWAITCWAGRTRSKAGRAHISYRKYKPLRSRTDLQEEEAEVETRYNEKLKEQQENGTDWLIAAVASSAATMFGNGSEGSIVTENVDSKSVANTKSNTSNVNGSTDKLKKNKKLINKKVNLTDTTKIPESISNRYDDSNEDSSSDDEEEAIFTVGPADKHHERGGTWFLDAASKWGGFTK